MTRIVVAYAHAPGNDITKPATMCMTTRWFIFPVIPLPHVDAGGSMGARPDPTRRVAGRAFTPCMQLMPATRRVYISRCRFYHSVSPIRQGNAYGSRIEE